MEQEKKNDAAVRLAMGMLGRWRMVCKMDLDMGKDMN